MKRHTKCLLEAKELNVNREANGKQILIARMSQPECQFAEDAWSYLWR